MTAPRIDIHKWSGMLLPSTLITLRAWEETKGPDFMRSEWDPLADSEWQQSRYIQFEWMFEDVPRAMRSVRCWMMGRGDGAQCDAEMEGIEQGLFGGVGLSNSDRANSTRLE